MLETLTDLMDPVATWVTPLIVTYLIHSTLILTTCWCVLQLAKRGNRSSFELEERVWKVAVLAGIFTAAIQVSMPGLPVSFLHLPMSAEVTDSVAARPMIDADAAEKNRSILPSAPHEKGWRVQLSNTANPDEIAALLTTEADTPVVEAASGPGIAVPVSNMISSRAIGSAISLGVLVCFAAGILSFFFAWLRLRRAIAEGQLIQNGPIRRSLDRVCRTKRVRKIRLIASTNQPQPVALGCIRPTILVPADIESRLSRKELEAVLSHETAHIARGDVWWLCLGRLLSICIPFQPLNRLAQSRWQAASEYLCDQWAIVNGTTPLSLARGLTEVASWHIDAPKASFASLPATCKSTLVGRVKRLTADQPVQPRWRWKHRLGFRLATVLIIGSVAVAAPTMARTVIEQEMAFDSPSLQSATGHSEWEQLRNEINLLDEEIERVAELAGNVMGRSGADELTRKKELLLQRFRSLEVEFKKELK